MRTPLHLALLTACLFVLPSCIVSGPQMPCTFAAVPVATGGAAQPAALGLAVGSPLQLRVTDQDANGNPTTGRSTYTSSDPSVATVNQDGQITPLKAGTTTITITSSTGATRTIIVTVTAPAAGALVVTPTSMTLNKLGPAAVPLKVTGAAAPTFVSSNPAVATVAADGTVTAVSNGQATITVTAGGQTAQVPITVAVAQTPSASATATPGGDLSIHVTPGAMGMPVGATTQLKVRISDSSKNVVNVQPSYVSSDPAIATVDASGLVTGVSPGKTTVTITVAGDTRTVHVNITKGGAMNVSPNSLTLNELGESGIDIKATSAKGSVAYTSSNASVATVDSDGTVTAVSNGTAVITVGDGTTTEDVAITVDTTAADQKSNNGNNGGNDNSNNANTDNEGTNSEGGNPGLGDNGSLKANFAADTCY